MIKIIALIIHVSESDYRERHLPSKSPNLLVPYHEYWASSCWLLHIRFRLTKTIVISRVYAVSMSHGSRFCVTARSGRRYRTRLAVYNANSVNGRGLTPSADPNFFPGMIRVDLNEGSGCNMPSKCRRTGDPFNVSVAVLRRCFSRLFGNKRCLRCAPYIGGRGDPNEPANFVHDFFR